MELWAPNRTAYGTPGGNTSSTTGVLPCPWDTSAVVGILSPCAPVLGVALALPGVPRALVRGCRAAPSVDPGAAQGGRDTLLQTVAHAQSLLPNQAGQPSCAPGDPVCTVGLGPTEILRLYRLCYHPQGAKAGGRAPGT